MNENNHDSCPYWIGHQCLKEFVNKIKKETIDQCLSIVGEYDFNTYQDLRESIEQLKNDDFNFHFEIEDEQEKNKDKFNQSALGKKIFDLCDNGAKEEAESEANIVIPNKETEECIQEIITEVEDLENETKLAKALNDQIQSNGTLCRKKVSYSFNNNSNILYLWTDIGFWKVLEKNDLFVLYHKNHYVPDIPFEEMSMGKYHRQADLGVTKSLGRVIKYIVDHDRAKAIMQDDYRNLPQTTKRQKMYYNRVKKKEKDKSIRRTDYLLQQLENGDFEEFKMSI